ncbi:MAG: SUF system NifU family Fe-S cluster assembly protein [Acidobacteria bacterium]|nr:SUF system NifU family Fe-S cluster assembly protein [Acidobacteriota bacterium]
MNDLQDLYQSVILDHSRNPRNFRAIDGANAKAEGYNPLCGDQVTVYLTLEDHLITDASFQGVGCAICTASSSMMTQQVKRLSSEKALQLFELFHDLVTTAEEFDIDTLGKLAVFSGVRNYPMRVKCASLPWHTLKAALEQKEQPVTTE